MNTTENSRYKHGLTYICAEGCDMEISVTYEGQGDISCCGKKMRRGRILPILKKEKDSKK